MRDLKVFNLMMVSLTLVSIDDKYNGVVKYNIDGETAILKNVSVTGLVKSLFNDPKRTGFVFGKKYTSVNNSNVHIDCPIKLIRTCNKEGELFFVLKITHEGKSTVKKFYTPAGNVRTQRYFEHLPKSKWMRYSDFYDYNIKRNKDKAEQKASA